MPAGFFVCGRARPAIGVALALCVALFSADGRAQIPARQADAVVETNEAGARRHFERALELYRAGQYAQALDPIQAAAKLDPDGKDLFFNLALVHEKLGQLSDAIAALERFRELETDAAERERARLSIERLRGAARAAAVPVQPDLPCPAAPAAPLSPRGQEPALIAAASIAVVSLVVGAVFGAKALSDDVGDASTSASFSVAQLRERGRRAEREALVADVAFAVAAASAGTFAWLWLRAPDEPAARAAGISLRSYF